MSVCVCPVVGTAALTLSVPQVRNAVHKATAPRAYAKPKTRVRQPAADIAAASAATASVVPCPTAVPVVLSDLALPANTDAVLPPLDFAQVNPVPTAVVPVPLVPGGTADIDNPPPPIVPEPTTWIQLILGFGLIGGTVRMSYRQRRNRLVSARIDGLSPTSERPLA